MNQSDNIESFIRKNLRKIFWTVVAIIFVSLNAIYYYLFGTDNYLQSLLIEFISALSIFIVIYLLFQYRGIRIHQILDIQRPLWLINGFETYKKVPWAKYFESASEITIVAFYFENWITKHDEELRTFLRKPNSKMTVFLPNYENEYLLDNISKLIPKYSPQQLKEKILHTISKIAEREFQEKNVNTKTKIDVWIYDHVFNYTLQAFDNTLLFSINELCRENDYKSPFIEINRGHSLSIQSFFSEEIATLTKGNKLVISKFYPTKK
ncbi:hypothetical protein KBD45_02930 [Candidatus Dojkabacteria bacterium]|nr:hypothetical protein [Candidatus Dojkabacteria bacterium]